MAITDKILSAFADACEPWKQDHIDAMECYEVEEVIGWGNTIFDRLSESDIIWHTKVNSGDIAYAQADFDQIQKRYREWLDIGEKWLPVIEYYEKRAYKVDQAERFRCNCEKARSIFVPDDEFFVGQKLAELRDKAIEDHRDGRTTDEGTCSG